MAVDRRDVIVGLGGVAGLTMAGCSRAQAPGRVSWAQFKTQFMAPDGRIVDNGNGGISHSEGQSYGLALAVTAGDREGFDAVDQWTQTHLARADVALHCWRYDPRKAEPAADRNNATDGDLMIAYALAKAADRWREPRYAKRSAAIVNAIATRLVGTIGGRTLLLPGLDGFSTPERMTVNPSYYVWPALDLFARTDKAGPWRRVITDGEALLTEARFGARHLPTDWVDVATNGVVSPAADHPPQFGFDAIRVPLYAAATGRSRLIEPISHWWRTMPEDHIPAWVDVVSGKVAEYSLSAGGRAVVARTIATQAVRAARQQMLATDYYAASLQCLAAIF